MVWAKDRSNRSVSERPGARVLLAAWLSVLAARCGGESVTHGSGSGGEGPRAGGAGGKGGSGVGASGGTGASGGVGGTGVGGNGTGGTATGGTGISGTGGTIPVTGGAGGSTGGRMPVAGAPQGGMTSDPFAHCAVPPLVSGTTCSFEATCAELECGAPWSLQNETGCLRTTCTTDSECGLGSACIPAPVAGKFDDFLTAGCESCEVSGDSCACICLEGGALRAVCLDRVEFPASEHCPIDGLSCAALAAAEAVTTQYLDSTAPELGTSVHVLLRRCLSKIGARRARECDVGLGGAGGEGGSG